MNDVQTAFSTDQLVVALKAAAEPTRLRILQLLAAEELNVKDLTQILAQSQPRISRHLKLLSEAGLVERFREGSWAYFHVSDRGEGGRLAHRLLETIQPDDLTTRRDRQRLKSLRRRREQAAQKYFREHAGEWDRIRTLYVPEQDVEAAMLAALGAGPFDTLVDLGTGTGRILELFAGRYRRGVGLDVNHAMLAYARSKVSAANLTGAEVRHGDVYNVPLPDGFADAVVIHQVLHYLSEPAHALEEAARLLAPGGSLLVVDFAPHDLEFLREVHAHERLGFASNQLREWMSAAGLIAFECRKLAPVRPEADQKLTVLLCTAQRPPPKTRSRALERAGALQEPEE